MHTLKHVGVEGVMLSNECSQT